MMRHGVFLDLVALVVMVTTVLILGPICF